MFKIYGIIKEENIHQAQRLCKNLSTVIMPNGNKSFSHPKMYDGDVFDFTYSFADFEKNYYMLLKNNNKKIIILPPFLKAAEFYSSFCDKIIISFPISENVVIGPYLSLVQLKKTLADFTPLKDKTIITLSAFSRDYSINSHNLKYMTGNQAQLKALIKQSVKFTDEELGISYFTYLNESGDARIVYVEDTYTLSLRHNMIKAAGFSGICWDNVYAVTEGNWESLKAAYMAVNNLH